MDAPADRHYTSEHEWLTIDGGTDARTAVVGVTAYAVDALGDVVYLDLPEVGASLTRGVPCGEIESTKSVSELFSPADGEVLSINEDVSGDPGLVNSDPYGAGWLFTMSLREVPELLDAAAYGELTSGGS